MANCARNVTGHRNRANRANSRFFSVAIECDLLLIRGRF